MVGWLTILVWLFRRHGCAGADYWWCDVGLYWWVVSPLLMGWCRYIDGVGSTLLMGWCQLYWLGGVGYIDGVVSSLFMGGIDFNGWCTLFFSLLIGWCRIDRVVLTLFIGWCRGFLLGSVDFVTGVVSTLLIGWCFLYWWGCVDFFGGVVDFIAVIEVDIIP